jgi:hypothetical protein
LLGKSKITGRKECVRRERTYNWEPAVKSAGEYVVVVGKRVDVEMGWHYLYETRNVVLGARRLKAGRLIKVKVIVSRW